MFRSIAVTSTLALLAALLATTAALADSPEEIRNALHPPAPDHLQIIVTDDSSRTFGRIVSHDEQTVFFATDLGELTIPLERIRSIREIPASALRNGRYWFPNSNVSRLYFAPTGRMLPKGSGYFADYYLFFPTVVYGLTDSFTLGGGFSLMPDAGLDKQLWYLTPKLSVVRGEEFNAAIGTLLISVPNWDEDEAFSHVVGVVYGVGTYGRPDASLTFGLGYGFVDDDLLDRPMIILGGEWRRWRRVAFVTENWWIPEMDHPLISYGCRFMGERMSVDLALINSFENLIFPGLPYIDFTFNF